MNIGQIARSQQMFYNVINRSGNSGYSAFSAYGGLLNGWGVGGSAGDDESNFFSTPAALNGTIRQIAQRLYDASFSSDAAEGSGTSITQGSGAYTGGDSALQALREQLGSKAEALRQLYQPDQTALADAFAQRQALAESLALRSQTVSLSGETTKKIQNLALMDAKNSAGVQEDGETEEAASTPSLASIDRAAMIQEEVQKFAPSKRAAAFNTINKLWEQELDRIGAYIKEKDPDWTAWGDEFDVSILDDYKAGVNAWA